MVDPGVHPLSVDNIKTIENTDAVHGHAPPFFLTWSGEAVLGERAWTLRKEAR